MRRADMNKAQLEALNAIDMLAVAVKDARRLIDAGNFHVCTSSIHNWLDRFDESLAEDGCAQ